MRYCIVVRSPLRDLWYFGDPREKWPFSANPSSAYCFDTKKDAEMSAWELRQRIKVLREGNKIEVVPEDEASEARNVHRR